MEKPLIFRQLLHYSVRFLEMQYRHSGENERTRSRKSNLGVAAITDSTAIVQSGLENDFHKARFDSPFGDSCVEL
jgi:hypothetical protein